MAEQEPHAEESFAAKSNASAPQILCLAEALLTEDLPSVGSAGHQQGTCKPCAFYHKQGCANGTQCSFCHLCGPEEKKKRQKGKIAVMREARQRNAVGGMTMYL